MAALQKKQSEWRKKCIEIQDLKEQILIELIKKIKNFVLLQLQHNTNM